MSDQEEYTEDDYGICRGNCWSCWQFTPCVWAYCQEQMWYEYDQDDYELQEDNDEPEQR